MFKDTKFSTTTDTCLRVEVVDLLVEEVFKQTNPEEPLEACLTHGATKEDENHYIVVYAFHFDSAAPTPYGGMRDGEAGKLRVYCRR
ncbi:hypothetical protein ACOSQ2_017081 [Xanthoceras sorbifolium]